MELWLAHSLTTDRCPSARKPPPFWPSYQPRRSFDFLQVPLFLLHRRNCLKSHTLLPIPQWRPVGPHLCTYFTQQRTWCSILRRPWRWASNVCSQNFQVFLHGLANIYGQRVHCGCAWQFCPLTSKISRPSCSWYLLYGATPFFGLSRVSLF